MVDSDTCQLFFLTHGCKPQLLTTAGCTVFNDFNLFTVPMIYKIY